MNDLTDFTVSLKMARKDGSFPDEVEYRTFTVTGPARNAKHAEAIAHGLGHGINEATAYAWKFCGGSDGVTVTPADGTSEVERLTAALTEARTQAATHANEVGRLVAENARVRQQRDEATPVRTARQQLDQALRDALPLSGGKVRGLLKALRRELERVDAERAAAVDALPKAEAAR